MKEQDKNKSRCLVAIITFVCVVIFFLDFSVVHVDLFNGTLTSKQMQELGGLYEKHLFPNLFISIFSHCSWVHLTGNLLYLVFVGEVLSHRYQWYKLFLVLILSAITGSLFPYLIHLNIVSMGISGGVFGWLGLLTISYLSDSKKRLSANNILILFAVGACFFMTLVNENVNVFAHVIGFVTGVLLGIVLDGFNKKSKKLKESNN